MRYNTCSYCYQFLSTEVDAKVFDNIQNLFLGCYVNADCHKI